MALNPNIALQSKAMDLGQVGQSFLQGQQAGSNIAARNRQLDLGERRQETQEKLIDSNIAQRNFQNMEAREQNRLKSATIAAVELGNFLDRNDTEGAANFLQKRRANLGQQIAQGAEVDTADTDEAIKMLQEDPEQLKQITQGAVSLGRQLGFLKDPRTEGKTPSAVQEFEFFEGLSPEQQKTFLSVKRQNQGFFIDPTTGRATETEGFTDVRRGIKEAEAAGTKKGQLETEKTFNVPKARASFESANIKFEDQLNKIEKVIPKVNELTAGFTGTLLSKIPGTKASDLKATIDTIVANLGFEELQTMRNNSPTGGALGAISERELALLTAAKQNLINSQSPEQLTENLQDLKDQLRLSNRALKRAFDQDFGKFEKQSSQVEQKKEEETTEIDFNQL